MQVRSSLSILVFVRCWLASLKPAQNNAPTKFSGLIAQLGSFFLNDTLSMREYNLRHLNLYAHSRKPSGIKAELNLWVKPVIEPFSLLQRGLLQAVKILCQLRRSFTPCHVVMCIDPTLS
jgi:hypothetical protein